MITTSRDRHLHREWFTVFLVAVLGATAATCNKAKTVDPGLLLHLERCQVSTGSCQWKTNYRFLDAVTGGIVPFAEDYYDALDYFESLTGIDAEIPGTWAGRPVDRAALKTALDQWTSWCAKRSECPDGLNVWSPDPGAGVDPITGSLVQ